MAVVRTHGQNIRLYSWLAGASLCLLLAFVFWMMTDEKQLVIEIEPIEETQVQIQPEKVAATANLGSLINQVRPLEKTKRVVISGVHDPEFKGTKFIQDNQKNWTIEIFRANKEEVIQNYLRDHPQRKDLLYFRLGGEQQAEQYVLAYGQFKTEDTAQAALAQLNLNLPVSVKPQSMSFAKYQGLVNDMGSDELSSNNKIYQVRLKPAAVPVIDETVLARIKASMNANAVSSENTTVTSTVTRKDQQGNVVDVQRQSSAKAPEPPKEKPAQTAPEQQQVTDPFS